MLRKTLILCIPLLFLSLFSFVSAASLQLLKIGGLSTEGKVYNEWWYTEEKPTLSGLAANSAELKIKVDATETAVKAATSGDWTYASNLTKGDYKIEVTSGAEKLAFTLHVGQNLPSSGNVSTTPQTTSSVPVTGANQLLGISAGFGTILLASYVYLWGDTKRKSSFVTKILKD